MEETAPARRAALIASLAAVGMEFFERDEEYSSVKLYKEYLRQGIGDPDQIAAKAKELEWLFDNTDIMRQMQEVSKSAAM